MHVLFPDAGTTSHVSRGLHEGLLGIRGFLDIRGLGRGLRDRIRCQKSTFEAFASAGTAAVGVGGPEALVDAQYSSAA